MVHQHPVSLSPAATRSLPAHQLSRVVSSSGTTIVCFFHHFDSWIFNYFVSAHFVSTQICLSRAPLTATRSLPTHQLSRVVSSSGAAAVGSVLAVFLLFASKPERLLTLCAKSDVQSTPQQVYSIRRGDRQVCTSLSPVLSGVAWPLAVDGLASGAWRTLPTPGPESIYLQFSCARPVLPRCCRS